MWSVNGIDADARSAAKAAARSAGLTLGEWLSRTIQNATETPAPPAAAPETLHALVETIGKLADRIELIEDRLCQSPETLTERIDALARDIEEFKSRTPPAAETVDRAIARLSERIQRLETQEAPDAGRKPAGLMSHDRPR